MKANLFSLAVMCVCAMSHLLSTKDGFWLESCLFGFGIIAGINLAAVLEQWNRNRGTNS